MNNLLLYVKFFYCGVFLTMSVYHLAIFFGRKSDLRNLAYFLYSITLTIMLLLFQIVYIFRPFPYVIPVIFCALLLALSLTYFLETVFDLNQVKPVLLKIKIVYFFICVVISVSMAINKNNINKYLFIVFTLFLLVIYTVFLLFNIIQYRQYRDRIKFWVLMGFIPVFGSLFTILILFSLGLAGGHSFSSFIPQYTGYLLMMIFFAYALGLQYKEDHDRLIELTKELEAKVEERTRAVRFSSKKLKMERIRRFCMIHKLSSRETQIMDMILSGKKNREIGGVLCISESTVKTYAKRIYRKTETKDRFDLISKMQDI